MIFLKQNLWRSDWRFTCAASSSSKWSRGAELQQTHRRRTRCRTGVVTARGLGIANTTFRNNSPAPRAFCLYRWLSFLICCAEEVMVRVAPSKSQRACWEGQSGDRPWQQRAERRGMHGQSQKGVQSRGKRCLSLAAIQQQAETSPVKVPLPLSHKDCHTLGIIPVLFPEHVSPRSAFWTT